MPTPTKGPRLGGSPAHQKAILANLATSLFEYGAITTTEAKARRLRPFAERLITKARRGDLHNRRQVMSVIRDKTVVHVLFTEIGPRFANRPGGYTRITKIGPRKGDNAPMAVIELVEAEFVPRAPSMRPAPSSTGSTASSAASATAGIDSATIDPDVTAPGAIVETNVNESAEAADAAPPSAADVAGSAEEPAVTSGEPAESAEALTEPSGGEAVMADDSDGAAVAEPVVDSGSDDEPDPPADGPDDDR